MEYTGSDSPSHFRSVNLLNPTLRVFPAAYDQHEGGAELLEFKKKKKETTVWGVAEVGEDQDRSAQEEEPDTVPEKIKISPK